VAEKQTAKLVQKQQPLRKQTTDTFMAGERIIEALDLADASERCSESTRKKSRECLLDDAIKLQPPPRNPVLAAYDIEPEAWVLRVVEKVQSTALQDALLVLPFGKVVSLMEYLNIWAQRVRFFPSTIFVSSDFFLLLEPGMEYHSCLAHYLLFVEDTSPSDRRQPSHAYRSNTATEHLRSALKRQKDTIGYNLAALRYIRRRNEAERTAQFYEEDGLDEDTVRAKIAEGKKRKRVSLKA
jgi:U3 small nucleolar RNA-associated protein 12